MGGYSSRETSSNKRPFSFPWLCTGWGKQRLPQGEIFQATSKGSDQTAHMRRLICGFAGRTYHIEMIKT